MTISFQEKNASLHFNLNTWEKIEGREYASKQFHRVVAARMDNLISYSAMPKEKRELSKR